MSADDGAVDGTLVDDVDEGRPPLFVPLKTGPYRRFEDGTKDVELRGQNPQFNPDTVVEGRPVELRRGYSTDDSLFGTVADVWVDDGLRAIVEAVGPDRIHPGASLNETVKAAIDLIGGYDAYIAFAVTLDGDEADRKVECTVCGARVGRGPNGLGIKKHAGKHRREFAEEFGRGPHDYAEVRERLGRPGYREDVREDIREGKQLRLVDAFDDRARDARNDDQQADLVNPQQLKPVDDETDADGGRE